MFLSVIIPTHRRNHSLFSLLASIVRQEYPTDHYEVLIVGNLFDRKTRKLVEDSAHFIPIRYIYSGRVGVNTARNLGIQVARGSIILFLDDDCLLSNPEHFSKLVKYHENNPDAVGIGGYYAFQPTGRAWVDAYQLQAYHWQKTSSLLVGGNASYKGTVFKLGFRFNEEIEFGGAESELNRRLIKNGFRFKICEELNVTHVPQMSRFDFFRKAFLQGLNSTRSLPSPQHNSWPTVSDYPSFNLSPKKVNQYLTMYDMFFQFGRLNSSNKKWVIKQKEMYQIFVEKFHPFWKWRQFLLLVKAIHYRKGKENKHFKPCLNDLFKQ